MALTFLLGGARSGKSALAVRLASEWGGAVVFAATAERRDDPEMDARIEAHAAERPPEWDTVEAPLDLGAVVASAAPDACLVVDCLTLWVANALETGWSDAETEAAAAELARLAAARNAPTIVVSNEVGLGVVPDTPLGRRYRDVLGRVNAGIAAEADRALLVVAGRALELR
jgi:adenosyl cobinamide kinase/adenosyl cobinamide phosphate guanylyltransferase